VTERPVALPPVDQREVAMPISPYLDGERFDPETKRVLGMAFELVRISLRTGDCDDDVYRAIATSRRPASTIPRFCAIRP
jgi:hypothetical protein